jgi:formylglycine-generating enzyme required for sulfatase activity
MPKTYCTYRIKVANRERVQVEKWNSLHQSLGEPSGAFRYLEKLDELTPQLSSASNNELNDSGRVRTLGETLFDILFDDVLRQDFVGFYEQVVHRDKQLLRIELVIDEKGMPEVAALPWEFMCLPERANLGTVWLSTAPEVVFSRRRSQYFAAEPIQLQKNEKLRIALVVASPPGLPLVAYEPIQQALEKLAQEKAELVELLPVLHSAGLESIDEMLSQNPHIVHFMGHCGLQDEQGREIGVIALVDPDSAQVLWVEAGNFSELLNQHRPGLVMLQASQSGRLSASQAFVGVASRVVQQNIPVVVAMQYEVSDTIASRFAHRFYKQLAEGDPVDIAAQYGRRAISLSSAQYKKRDFATPVIFMRVENGYLFQTYKEEAPAPSSSVEVRRRLEAAMPQKSQVDRPTEIRVMVALHDSPGLRATLPDVTESGDLIQKNDAVQNDVALEFPVDSKTREPLPINIFVSLTAPGFKIEQPAKSIRVSPKYDSGIITFFLTPAVAQKYGRVVVEWFSDEQKNTLLGSLTLITEALESQNQSVEALWKIEKTIFDLRNSKYSDISITQEISSLEGGTLIGIKIPEASGAMWIDGNEFARGECAVDLRAGIGVDADIDASYQDSQILYGIVDIKAGYQYSGSIELGTVEELTPNKLTQFEIAVITHDSVGHLIINRSIQQNQYFIEDLGNGIGLEMMLIPGGSFVMGSAVEEEAGENPEKPLHFVSIQTLCMSKYPITQVQWRAIAALPGVKQELNPDPAYFKGDDRPIEQISWEEAIEFCDRLSRFARRDYRLPTEAEWEYACRAGSTTPFNFGETIITDVANYDGTDSYGVEPKGIYRKETTVVGSFGIANAFGLCDMHGNVWEWCLDHWHDTYEGSPTDGSAWLSEIEKSPRLTRGGSFDEPPQNCGSASRERFDSDSRSRDLGFRIVCSPHKRILGIHLGEI